MRKMLKWTNRFSQESGFVKSVPKSYGHFINTWEQDEAKVYRGEKMLANDLKALEDIGETENNIFEVIDLEQ